MTSTNIDIAKPAAPETGGCLCRSIRYSVAGELRHILDCHCENCRRLTGTYFSASGCATRDLTVKDDSTLRWYDVGYARYAFCTNCGSSLFWQGAEHMERTSILAGTLDDASALELRAIWFADEAQTHHVLDPSVPHHPSTARIEEAPNEEGA